jgi:hypothetical protein
MQKLSQEVQATIDSLEKFDFFYFHKYDKQQSRLSCKVNIYS